MHPEQIKLLNSKEIINDDIFFSIAMILIDICDKSQSKLYKNYTYQLN